VLTVQRDWARRLSPRMLLVALTSAVMVLSALAVSQADIGSPKPVSVATLSGDAAAAPLPADFLPGEDLAAEDLAAEVAPESPPTTAADSTTTTSGAKGRATSAVRKIAAPPCPKTASEQRPCAPPCSQPGSADSNGACPPPCAQPACPPPPPPPGAPPRPRPPSRPACPPPPCGQTDPAPPAKTAPAQPGQVSPAQPAQTTPAQPVRDCPPPCSQYDTANAGAGRCPQPCPAYATADGKPAPCPPPCDDTPQPDSGSAVDPAGPRVASMCAPPCSYAQEAGSGAAYGSGGSGVAYSCPPPPCAYPTEPDGGIGDSKPAVMIYCRPPCERDASCPPPCYEAQPAAATTTSSGTTDPVPPSQSCPPPPCPGSKTCPPPCPSAAATDQSCTPPCSYEPAPGGWGVSPRQVRREPLTTASGAGSFAPCPEPSGVEGRVTAGPTCPVERPDQPCADKPVETTLRLLRKDGSVAATTKSGPDGTFKVAVAPGSYRLVADWPSRVGGCGPVDVTVERGRFTHADVSCDNGIR
jgi:hypothetical protein